LCWKKPTLHKFKLNVDACKRDNGGYGIGGIIKDHKGRFTISFKGVILANNITFVEGKALLMGMKLDQKPINSNFLPITLSNNDI
jgi:hypothetical protein